MKAILEFNLPEEEEQFNAANKGMDWALLVWHIDQFIRNKIKYKQDRERQKFQLVHKLLLESGLRRHLEFSTNSLIVFYIMNYMFL